MDNPENHPRTHQTHADATQAPGERAPRLFTHPQGIRGQMSFLDQRSMVIASLLTAHTQDAGCHPPAKR